MQTRQRFQNMGQTINLTKIIKIIAATNDLFQSQISILLKLSLCVQCNLYNTLLKSSTDLPERIIDVDVAVGDCDDHAVVVTTRASKVGHLKIFLFQYLFLFDILRFLYFLLLIRE